MRKAQTNNSLVQASFYLTLILGNIFIVDITAHIIIELNVFVFWLILILFYNDIRRWERGLIMRGLIIVTMEEVINISQRLKYHSRYHHNNKPEYCDGYKHCHQCGHRSVKHRSVSSFRYEVMKSAVALWDAARLVSRSLCPGNFSLWWVGEENSGFAYANGPPSFFLLFS